MEGFVGGAEAFVDDLLVRMDDFHVKMTRVGAG